MRNKQIDIFNVSKRYGKEVVIDRINHTFAEGAIHGIIGRNGSGKTTLLRMICGLTVPTEGEIRVNETLINVSKTREFAKDIGVLFDTGGFIPYYSGYKNLAYLASIQRKITRDEIEDAMLRVGLSPKEKKWVSKYSLGMKQRLGIAQAIMERPKILLLDEPMNGLDKYGVVEVRKLFCELRDQGTTILLASHTAEDIEVLCDTVIELDHGRLSVIR